MKKAVLSGTAFFVMADTYLMIPVRETRTGAERQLWLLHIFQVRVFPAHIM
jgi:hypothetical protein